MYIYICLCTCTLYAPYDLVRSRRTCGWRRGLGGGRAELEDMKPRGSSCSVFLVVKSLKSMGFESQKPQRLGTWKHKSWTPSLRVQVPQYTVSTRNNNYIPNIEALNTLLYLDTFDPQAPEGKGMPNNSLVIVVCFHGLWAIISRT